MNKKQQTSKRVRDRFINRFHTRYWELEDEEFPISVEQRLHLVDLTLQQVMTYAYKQADKTLNKDFKPVDDTMKPYRFQKKQ